MTMSLEEYVAQATQAYQPTSNAIQAQLNALPGQLESTNTQINKNYAQQQAGLNRQRNMAAETASMQAAGSGGSFGGAANIANRKYYDQAFVPAVTQMNTNKANELERARQDNESQKLALMMQKAQGETQAQEQALAQFYAAQEAERNRAAQIAAARASNPYQYMDNGRGSNTGSGESYKNWDFGNGYSIQELPNGEADYRYNGRQISAGQFLNATGANGANWDMWNDVWNNGVSTRGVGSDTVEAFNKFSPKGYEYLF